MKASWKWTIARAAFVVTHGADVEPSEYQDAWSFLQDRIENGDLMEARAIARSLLNNH